MMRICLISGPIASGKSAVGSALVESFGFMTIKSSAYLRETLRGRNIDITRRNLQDLGDNLDLETDYKWLIEPVALSLISKNSQQKRWLMDSVRKSRQIEHFREAFPKCVWHVHITAPERILEERYLRRQQVDQLITPYQDAVNHENEQHARRLIDLADLVIDTEILPVAEIAIAIFKLMGLEADAEIGNNQR